jgi:hypothetical protein
MWRLKLSAMVERWVGPNSTLVFMAWHCSHASVVVTTHLWPPSPSINNATHNEMQWHQQAGRHMVAAPHSSGIRPARSPDEKSRTMFSDRKGVTSHAGRRKRKKQGKQEQNPLQRSNQLQSQQPTDANATSAFTHGHGLK